MKPITRVTCRFATAAILAATMAGFATAWSEPVNVEMALAHPTILANQKQTTYLRVNMIGEQPRETSHRAPINVAFVLDKSGSMQGEKINRAKDAMRMALDKMRDEDIVSIVVYDSTVQVLVPATKLTDRSQIASAIAQISADGSTALFAGVSKGAAELRKFFDKERVNRIILLSDGLANVGPSSPGELAELGTSLGREGIAVTTIGLGLDYNEDLMTKLALNSDGNHMFAENAADLDKVFASEFGDVLAVVAQEVNIVIHCAEGVRPIRVLGREADIVGQTVTLSMNQLYGGQAKYVILEVEIPAGNPKPSLDVASLSFRYRDMSTNSTVDVARLVSAKISDSPKAVEENINKEVMTAAVYQIGVERNMLATRLRDEGKVDEARQVLDTNARYLKINADEFKSKDLDAYSFSNRAAADNLDESKWKR